MKKVILTALVAIVAVGGSFAGKYAPAKQKPANAYTYYQETACNVPVVCADEYLGPQCSTVFTDIVIYDRPGCDELHQVAIPQGKLPL